MIIGGQFDVVGNRPMDVAAIIDREDERPSPVAITLERDGGTLSVALEAEA